MTSINRVDLGLQDAAGCSCCAAPAPSARPETPPGPQQMEIRVQGMTCSHCVSRVTDEISGLEDVQSVSVELNPGGASTVTISSDNPIDADLVRAAVEEAGYSLASLA